MGKVRRFGFAAMAMALLAAAGCGGSSASFTGAAESPPPSDPAAAAPDTASAAPAPGGFEAQGYGQPGAAPATPAAPPPADEPAGSVATTEARPSAGAPRRMEAKEKATETTPDAAARPGLGTQWGETRTSRISTVPFKRADPSRPFVTAALFYNDEQGARAMANSAGFQRTAGQAFSMAGGAVAIGLRGEHGGFLSGFIAGDRRFIVGEAGLRYSIVLRNLTPNRFECVVSVDGLDVLDGQPASFSKRGYILVPHGELEIEGFRQSMDAVAAFRFGSVRGSYANQKHGDARNVGVIGVALFHERGTSPWTPQEINRRNQANPFPGQ